MEHIIQFQWYDRYNMTNINIETLIWYLILNECSKSKLIPTHFRMQKKEKTGLSIDPCLVNPQYKNVSFIFYQLFCRCVVKGYLGAFVDGNSSSYNDLPIFCERFGSVSFAAACDQTSHIIECLKDWKIILSFIFILGWVKFSQIIHELK